MGEVALERETTGTLEPHSAPVLTVRLLGSHRVGFIVLLQTVPASGPRVLPSHLSQPIAQPFENLRRVTESERGADCV